MKTYGEFFTMLIQASDVVLVATPTGDIYFHPLKRHVGKTPDAVGIRVFRENVLQVPNARIYTNEIPFAEHFHNKNTRKAL